MNKQIWKFDLRWEERGIQVVEMPNDAEILFVDEQRGDIKLWAMVEPERMMVKRWFQVFGTGWPIDDECERKYIGTAQIYEGDLVWHVFEVAL